MNYKTRLIKKLFSNKLEREELRELSEMDFLERRLKEQWLEYDLMKESTERIEPEIGDYIWKKILKEYKTRSKRKSISRYYYPLAAACAVLVALVGGWLFYVNSDSFMEDKFVEVIASQNMLYQLPDSSEVWMYPNSSIRFAKKFNKDRRVWLEGSSMFNVRKSNESTFKVYLDKAFIEVKGTRFLVNEKTQHDQEITLFNGCIEFNVETTGEQLVMNPMERIHYNSANAEMEMQKIENIEWKDGGFKFNAMPLSHLISIINQMYHANIVYVGKDEMAPFSGTIHQETSLDDIVHKICFLMNLKEERIGSKIIIRN